MADERQTRGPLMGVREFLRGGYAAAERPVTVLSRAEVVGTWYPVGTEPAAPRAVAEDRDAQTVGMPVRRMTQGQRDAVLRKANGGRG